MKTCPNCNSGWLDSYSNGTWVDEYCQQCSHENRRKATAEDKADKERELAFKKALTKSP